MTAHNPNRDGALGSMFAVAALALVAIALWGCATPVYHRGDLAADSAQAAATQIDTTTAALAATLTTLTNLVEKPDRDLKPQFLSFSASLDTLIAAAKHDELAAAHLAHSNDVFFASWDKQLTTITNADIRQRSADRRNEASNEFRTVNERYAQARQRVQSFIGYLGDVRRALSTDLTPKGIEAIQPTVATVVTNAADVRADLARANNNLEGLSAQMSSSRFAAAQ